MDTPLLFNKLSMLSLNTCYKPDGMKKWIVFYPGGTLFSGFKNEVDEGVDIGDVDLTVAVDVGTPSGVVA